MVEPVMEILCAPLRTCFATETRFPLGKVRLPNPHKEKILIFVHFLLQIDLCQTRETCTELKGSFHLHRNLGEKRNPKSLQNIAQ